VSGELQGVIVYGYGVDAVVEALHALDPRYVPADHVTPEPGQVLVLRREDGAHGDATRDSAPHIAWLVVELYRREVEATRSLTGTAAAHA
jgi:hypothetical protein